MDTTTTESPISADLLPVESTQLAAIGHDAETNTLYIQFKARPDEVEGSIYSYQNVTPELFDDFRRARSIGSFFYNNIKPEVAKYPYTKIRAGVKADDQAVA